MYYDWNDWNEWTTFTDWLLIAFNCVYTCMEANHTRRRRPTKQLCLCCAVMLSRCRSWSLSKLDSLQQFPSFLVYCRHTISWTFLDRAIMFISRNGRNPIWILAVIKLMNIHFVYISSLFNCILLPISSWFRYS